jgi:WD40 repeat protein
MADPAADGGARTRGLALGAQVTGVAFAGDSKSAAFALGSGTLAVLDVAKEDPPRALAAHRGAILSLAPHPAGGFLTGGDDGRLVRTHAGAGGDAVEEIASFKGKWVESVAVHARSGLFAAAVGREMHLYGRPSSESGAPRVFGPHPSTITDLDFSPDGSRLAGAHYGGVSIWTVRNPADVPRKLAWKGSHLKLRYSPNGRFLATATQENAIHVWRLASGSDMQMAGYPAKIQTLGWSADTGLLLSSGAEPFVLWSFAGKGPEGQPPVEFGGAAPGALMTAIAVHRSAAFAIAGYDNGEVVLGDLAARRVTPLKSAGDGAVSALAWSPDGLRIAFGTESGAAAVVDLDR